MNMKKAAGILIPCALAGTFAVSSVKFADYAVSIKPQTLEEAWNWQKDHYDVSWYKDTDPVEYTVESYDGYTLHAVLMHARGPAGEASPSAPDLSAKASASDTDPSAKASASDTDPSDSASASGGRFVICSHGYTDNRYGTLKYAKIYLDLGYNVIAYDLRGHGENERTFCTYSIREAKDLSCLIEDAYARFGQDITLGLHGESLGAATSVAVLKYTQKPAFVVADCGFADIMNVLKGGLKNMNPALVPMVWPASLAAKIKYGYSFTDMRPIDSLKDNHVPVLFIHGEDDTFIDPSNSRRMAGASAGYTEFFLIPGAVHAKSVLTRPEMYTEYVTDFLQKVGSM